MPAYVPQSRHASTCSAVNQSCILHGFCKMNDAEQSNTTLPKFVALFGRFGSKNPRGSNSNAMPCWFLAQFDQLATPGCCSGLCKGTGAVRSMVSLVLTPLTWQNYWVKCLAFTLYTQPWIICRRVMKLKESKVGSHRRRPLELLVGWTSTWFFDVTEHHQRILEIRKKSGFHNYLSGFCSQLSLEGAFQHPKDETCTDGRIEWLTPTHVLSP